MFEYMFVATYHRKELKWDSFLINQSTAYCVAAFVSWVEYALEFSFMPKELTQISMIFGLVLVTIGHFCRINAMFHAGRSFHHIVQSKKAETHVLITDGIYGYLRHPSYWGWSVWAVGT